MSKKEAAPKYGPILVEIQSKRARYLIKPDYGSNCWILERWLPGSKSPRQFWFGRLAHAHDRLRDVLLQDDCPSIETATALDRTMAPYAEGGLVWAPQRPGTTPHGATEEAVLS